jgi:hypothetical protein
MTPYEGKRPAYLREQSFPKLTRVFTDSIKYQNPVGVHTGYTTVFH